MPTGTKTVTVSTSGQTYLGAQDTITNDAKAVIGPSSIAAAKVGTLSTRTDNNTGILTMTTGHGFTDGQRLDVYWSGGCRRGMVIGTVSTNSVPIDLGAGDNLPIATTAVTAIVPNMETCSFAGANVTFAMFSTRSPYRAQVVFAQSDDTEVAYGILSAGANGDVWSWTSSDGTTTPFASQTVARVYFSHEYSGAAETSLIAEVLYS
jgi:hypothetical protein